MTRSDPDDFGAPTRMTLPEALEVAKSLHRAGKLDAAGAVYAQVFETAPDYVDALHFYGVFKHQNGDTEAGIELIRRSLALAPANVDAQNNLGNVLLQARRYAEAAEIYAAALVLKPDHVYALNNAGMALSALGRLEEAEAAYRAAIAAAPAYSNPRENLVDLLAKTSRSADAVVALRDWVAAEPDNATAHHLLAALSGENVPERASSDYVESTFDRFAESFDRNLAKLDYRAPDLVTDAVGRVFATPARDLAVLDAGCGTGLCGPGLAPFARRLAGVDLSGEMLSRARDRGCYGELEKAELTAYLLAHPGEFDLVVSADTLCYFGQLEAALAAAHAALRPGGILVFTVEEGAGADAVQLNLHGRYSHSRRYVEDALAASGFVAREIRQDVLRRERGESVAGLVVTAGR